MTYLLNETELNKSQKTEMDSNLKLIRILKKSKIKKNTPKRQNDLPEEKYCLLIGQNSFTGQCGRSIQRIYNIFKMPIAQQQSGLGNNFCDRMLETCNFIRTSPKS